MTEQNPTGPGAQNRPALEITPAMIEAGAETLLLHYGEDGDTMAKARRVVGEIFQSAFARLDPAFPSRDICERMPSTDQ